MILHVSPEAPAAVAAAAQAILYAHIGGAFAGLVSGGAAMIFRKGGRLHRVFGNIFFVAMLAMSGVGAAVAPFLPAGQAPNTMMGVFVFYLVATGWATVRRGPGQIGRFEFAAAGLALATAAAGAAFIWFNAHGPNPLPPPEGPVILIFAVVTTLAAACDIAMLRRGGLTGAARATRHLWRMSLALLIAAGSFAGQPKAIPRFLHGSPLVLLPAVAVLLSLIYWLIRVRLAPALRARATRQQPLRPAFPSGPRTR